jgi:hypothetical protein
MQLADEIHQHRGGRAFVLHPAAGTRKEFPLRNLAVFLLQENLSVGY